MLWQGKHALRTLVTGLIIPVLLSGCLMEDTVEEASTTFVATGSNSPPQLSGTAPRMIKVGVQYSFIPVAIDLDGDPLFFRINNKPDWMTFDANIGLLTGVPSLANEGTYNDIEIIASDGDTSTMLPPFSITVESIAAPNMPPEIDGTPPRSVIVGETYTFTPSGSDPDGDLLTYRITNRPSWVSFNSSTGRLVGVPRSGEEGSYRNISVTVSDGFMTSSLPSFTIDVAAANSAPQISGNPSSSVVVGQNYSFTPTSSDVDGDQLTFTIQNRPDWAQFSTTTGTLSGTPQAGDAGNYANISISVSDGDLNDSSQSFSITVEQITLGSATLNWNPPTQNDDGSALVDLAGYRVYYGTSPGSYPNVITINNSGVSSYVVQNLGPGTWRFVTTSFNSSGVESSYSNVASKTVN